MAGRTTRTGVIPNIAPANEVDIAISKQQHNMQTEVALKDKQRKSLAQQYAQEEKVSVMIAPMYAAYFGKVMKVELNGIPVAVPCDGRPYTIPKSYAAEVQSRLRMENDKQAKQKRFSECASNVESSPGALKLN